MKPAQKDGSVKKPSHNMTTKNSNHWFVPLLFWSMATIFVLTVISFLVCRGITIWLTIAAALITAAALLIKIWDDNRHLHLSSSKLTALMANTLFLWLPFGFLLVPGIMGVRYFDAQLERGVSYIDQQAADKVKQVEFENYKEITVSGAVWYKPWTWGSEISKVVRETVVRDVIEKASWSERLGFGFVYAALRSVQYLYYAGLGLVVVRSFGYVLARSAVRRSNQFDFTLPLAR
jgi:hypothetical protein